MVVVAVGRVTPLKVNVVFLFRLQLQSRERWEWSPHNAKACKLSNPAAKARAVWEHKVSVERDGGEVVTRRGIPAVVMKYVQEARDRFPAILARRKTSPLTQQRE